MMDRPEQGSNAEGSYDRLTLREVETLLADEYGIRGQVSPLPGETDENWRVAAEFATYRIRISPPGVRATSVGVEVEAFRALSRSDIRAPNIVATLSKAPLSSTPDGRVVRVLTWIDAQPYAVVGRSPQLDRSIGRCAGQMLLALSGIDGSRRAAVPWNIIDSTEFIRSRLAMIEDPHRRSIVWRAAEDLERDVHPRKLPTSMVHNDLNDLNVLVDGGEVAGVIDFGDMTRTYRVAELAIAATYVMLGRRDPMAAASRVVASFVEVVAIAADEALSIFDLIRGRLAMSVSQAASRGHIENAHQQVSADDAWDLIERLDAADRVYCTRVLAEAAGHGAPT